MSKGLGRIQRGCLRVIEEYEAAGTRFGIAAVTGGPMRSRSLRRQIAGNTIFASGDAGHACRDQFVLAQVVSLTSGPPAKRRLRGAAALAGGT